LVPHDMMSDCQAAFIAEFFSPRLRYSGSPLGFHLASIVAGQRGKVLAQQLVKSAGRRKCAQNIVKVALCITPPAPQTRVWSRRRKTRSL
jgi:hypothetical protein